MLQEVRRPGSFKLFTRERHASSSISFPCGGRYSKWLRAETKIKTHKNWGLFNPPRYRYRYPRATTRYFDTLISMFLDTAWTNTPAGYPARRSATSAWPLCICSFGHRALRASSIVFLSSLTRSLTLARCAKTPVCTEAQDRTTPLARRAPVEVLGLRPSARPALVVKIFS